jgi:AraC-like DNA-binding protein
MPVIAAIALEGLATDYPAGALIPPHRHSAHQIVHAVAGVMRVTIEDGSWIVPPGRGLWVPAETEHAIRCVSLVRMRTVYLTGAHPAFPRLVQVTAVSALMQALMVRVAEGAAPDLLPHLAALLIGELVAGAVEPLRLPRPQDARMARLCAALQADPADRTPLAGWAARLGLSRRTLIRRIQAETGMSFRELRRQARILAALERLALGSPITAVALDVGFESASAFSHAFRCVTGTTPARYLR